MLDLPKDQTVGPKRALRVFQLTFLVHAALFFSLEIS